MVGWRTGVTSVAQGGIRLAAGTGLMKGIGFRKRTTAVENSANATQLLRGIFVTAPSGPRDMTAVFPVKVRQVRADTLERDSGTPFTVIF